MPEIHELKPMDLWEAWQNEARDFTPWLAEHLERLGTELNLDLQLEGQEVTLPRGGLIGVCIWCFPLRDDRFLRVRRRARMWFRKQQFPCQTVCLVQKRCQKAFCLPSPQIYTYPCQPGGDGWTSSPGRPEPATRWLSRTNWDRRTTPAVCGCWVTRQTRRPTHWCGSPAISRNITKASCGG